MKYAQIKNGMVQNVIVIDDSSLVSLFGKNFDDIIKVDEVYPNPGPGWSYDRNTYSFSPPQVEDNG